MKFYAQAYLIAAVLTTVAVAGCDNNTATAEAAEASAALVAEVEADGKSADKSADKAPGCCDEHLAAEKANKPSFHYSPFYVELGGGGEFDVITFKDVGLVRGADKRSDPLLEVIAESLSYSIATSELGYAPANVSYKEELADPANHLACGQNHLYVDVWKNGAGKYGYSLWSGCGEADNFAWNELDEPARGETLADEVEPLTEAITNSIAQAKEERCFRKHC